MLIQKNHKILQRTCIYLVGTRPWCSNFQASQNHLEFIKNAIFNHFATATTNSDSAQLLSGDLKSLLTRFHMEI